MDSAKHIEKFIEGCSRTEVPANLTVGSHIDANGAITYYASVDATPSGIDESLALYESFRLSSHGETLEEAFASLHAKIAVFSELLTAETSSKKVVTDYRKFANVERNRIGIEIKEIFNGS